LHQHPPVPKTPYLGVHETGSSSDVVIRNAGKAAAENLLWSVRSDLVASRDNANFPPPTDEFHGPIVLAPSAAAITSTEAMRTNVFNAFVDGAPNKTDLSTFGVRFATTMASKIVGSGFATATMLLLPSTRPTTRFPANAGATMKMAIAQMKAARGGQQPLIQTDPLPGARVR
jgi:hypothetical protein